MSDTQARKQAATPGTPTRLKTLPLPVLLGAMLLAGLCALLALNTASAAQELKQRSLSEANASASDHEQQLLRDLAAKQAPAALASAAAAQGLVPNPNPAFLRINANGSVTVLGSPVPASSAAILTAPTPTASPAAPASTAPSRPSAGHSSAAKPGRPTSTAARPHPSSSSTKPSPHPSPTGGH
ncbi:MAG TPA: hypothetical protein VHO01_03935 [Jatrophihabitans sp.]|nr:hypothetical protein [Jatrophihabitans sp.]